MDCISSFDIRLEKDVYYAGETIVGCVVVETSDAMKIRGIRVFLRGRSRVQWKVLKSGESRTLKDDQYLLDERLTVWGRSRSGGAIAEATASATPDDSSQILPAGLHQFNFSFQLPQSQFPCSLETKAGTIRYYLKVIIDIPYASSPQGIKYFTLIGPHTDCMEEKFLAPLSAQDHRVQCILRCCRRGTIALRTVLERTAYCCGESLKLRAHIENRQDFTVHLCVRLFQHIEYRIERSVSGSTGVATVAETKSCVSTVLEYRSPTVQENSQCKFDSLYTDHPIKLPVVPPTMIGVCRLLQIYYTLVVCIEDERKNESLKMDFPLTIATVPYRSTHSQVYSVGYDFCVDYVESGRYISPEFRMGHVYDGAEQEGANNDDTEDVLLYRPVYVKSVDKHHQQVLAGKLAKELIESREAAIATLNNLDDNGVSGGGGAAALQAMENSITVESFLPPASDECDLETERGRLLSASPNDL